MLKLYMHRCSHENQTTTCQRMEPAVVLHFTIFRRNVRIPCQRAAWFLLPLVPRRNRKVANLGFVLLSWFPPGSNGCARDVFQTAQHHLAEQTSNQCAPRASTSTSPFQMSPRPSVSSTFFIAAVHPMWPLLTQPHVQSAPLSLCWPFGRASPSAQLVGPQ